MGHHNAQLDPLGISCVNFDDAPVNTGFQDVGENIGAKDKLLTVCGVNVALPPTLPQLFLLYSLLLPPSLPLSALLSLVRSVFWCWSFIPSFLLIFNFSDP